MGLTRSAAILTKNRISRSFSSYFLVAVLSDAEAVRDVDGAGELVAGRQAKLAVAPAGTSP
jgi:hypothetical protein